MIHGQLLYVFFFLSLQGPNSVFSLPLESKKPMKLEDVPLVRIKFRLSSSERKTEINEAIINEAYISGSSFFLLNIHKQWSSFPGGLCRNECGGL